MTDPNAIAHRLDALEMRIAYQDHTIDELNTTITEQWRIIDLLTRKLTQLEEQAKLTGGGAGDNRAEPPPPHY
ncbi:SlyX family protein [Devosia rhodophyticola]|uniref:Protein SlyX homolog n=1 Tax=Devosia rhodophyticola TaxID=3026423 RepID=A0ABY7YVK9_9HYPH|nr:SlyX family protein [Devosia rhodophyticola]WDR04890.1 SlyX family protein [Devosia rhodophyticola]